LTGGFGFGGPCFPRDNVALDFMGQQLGVDTRLLKHNHDYNRALAARFVKNIRRYLPEKGNVTVLGLAYKSMSHVIEESPGVYLCKALSNAGYRVIGHDPLAAPYAELALKTSALVTDNLTEALCDAEAIVVTTTDLLYTRLTADEVVGNGAKMVVFDIWRALPHLAADSRISYVATGRNDEGSSAHSELMPLWD